MSGEMSVEERQRRRDIAERAEDGHQTAADGEAIISKQRGCTRGRISSTQLGISFTDALTRSATGPRLLVH